MPQRLNPDKLGKPRHDQDTIELRFVNDWGQTEAWFVAIGTGDLNQFRESVVTAYLDDAVDTRLGRQAKIIERMSAHIQHHHDEAGIVSAETCAWQQKYWEDGVAEAEAIRAERRP